MPAPRRNPNNDATKVAWYFRRYRNIGIALLAYVRTGAGGAGPTLRADRDRAIKVLRKALGIYPFNHAAGLVAIQDWCKALPAAATPSERRVARHLRRILYPLIQAFENPGHFMRTIAPRLYPAQFDPATLDPSKGEDSSLDLPFGYWGTLALLNRAVGEAFRHADPILQNFCLDAAERRELSPRAGRPPALTVAAFWRLHKHYGGDFTAMAAAVGMTVGALEKRLQRMKRAKR